MPGCINQSFPKVLRTWRVFAHRHALMILQVPQGFNFCKPGVLQHLPGCCSLLPAMFEHQPSAVDQHGLNCQADMSYRT